MRLLTGQEIHSHREQSKNNFTEKPVIVCDRIKSSENVGSFFRLSDAFDTRLIFIDPIASINKGIRTACGTDNHVDYLVTDLEGFLVKFGKSNLIAVDLIDSAVSIFNSSLPIASVFVFGNESYGIQNGLLNACSSAVFIPMFGVNNSMNVASAASIVAYEWCRQNR